MTPAGATVGAGVEFGFAPNWSAAVEYDHLFMQDRTYTFTRPSVGSSRPSASAKTSISSPFASTIAGAARSSQGTDRDLIRFQKLGRPRAGLLVLEYVFAFDYGVFERSGYRFV
jgi:hypothetical protein